MTSTRQQIEENAAWVSRKFASESGLEAFADAFQAVDYLEKYLVTHEAEVRATPLNINKYVHLLGSYLGELMISHYDGTWCEMPKGMAVEIRTSTDVQRFHPFEKVYQRITEGTEHDLAIYFSNLGPSTPL